MSDAYNVRANGDRYYVYRIDGNVPVAEYMGPGAAAKAQRETAIRNQQHNEQFGKKKELEPEATSASAGEVQTTPYPEPQKLVPDSGEVLGPNQQATKISESKKQKSEVPNPPPGQGASY
jgi:hypothetical protein